MSSIFWGRAAVLATLALALLLACGGPTPPPQPTPSGAPIGSPGVDASPGATSPSGPVPSPSFAFDPGALAERPPQPNLPGLYLPAGVLAQGTDHFALIQARMDCPTLKAVLGAGQWSVIDHGSLVLPTQDPAQPTPEVPLPELTPPDWLLLRWGNEYAFARVGGDENGCLAQVTRLARAPYAAHGAIESSGEGAAMQVMCAAGSGVAEIATVYFGDDGAFFSFQTAVPLEIGSHPLDEDTDLEAGARGPSVEAAFALFYGGATDNAEEEIPGIEPYAPADLSVAVWPGSLEVASIDPLVGTINFEGVRNEAGESLTLTAPFRCDLPLGQLTRAAEQQAEPTAVPSPSPAPGRLSVEIAEGPHAGPQELTSSDVTCSLGLFGAGDWSASYVAPEPVAGEVQSLTVTAHANGKADVFMTLGDDFDHDWFNTDSALVEVSDHGASVDIAVTGHSADSDFTIDIICYDIFRF